MYSKNVLQWMNDGDKVDCHGCSDCTFVTFYNEKDNMWN